ncbi:amino acid ABC transporter permease [Salidesulfovibrio brasiliensis]|uniref:amino acid ABC transporter permease n=1 Tax=Salidesulfovibrio brasiliensis TaxID=221711 RepID=UPI0006D2AFDE|nr:amino acid ABC transporter permease [Salidesulfovibrio brasiliensis]
MTQNGCSLPYEKACDWRQCLLDTAQYALVMAGVCWLLLAGSERLGYNWQWYQIPKYLFTMGEEGFRAGPLLDGLLVTFQITAASMGLAFAVGLATALFRMSSYVSLRTVARVYMELIRNSPLLIQLFFIYFVIAPVLDMSAFWAAVLALSLFEGAYASEIFRAGITSIDKGQFEAARGQGMGPYVMYTYIILPQAIRRILPPLTGQVVSLVKDSALVSTIAIMDLTMQGQNIVAETFLTFEVWFTVAAIYLAVTVTLSRLAAVMEKRLMLT